MTQPAALITSGIGPGGFSPYFFTGGLDLEVVPPSDGPPQVITQGIGTVDYASIPWLLTQGLFEQAAPTLGPPQIITQGIGAALYSSIPWYLTEGLFNSQPAPVTNRFAPPGTRTARSAIQQPPYFTIASPVIVLRSSQQSQTTLAQAIAELIKPDIDKKPKLVKRADYQKVAARPLASIVALARTRNAAQLSSATLVEHLSVQARTAQSQGGRSIADTMRAIEMLMLTRSDSQVSRLRAVADKFTEDEILALIISLSDN